MGTNGGVSDLLNELLSRTYSDEGPLFGAIGLGAWEDAAPELLAWLVRFN